MAVVMDEAKLQGLFRWFDSDCNGYLDFTELLVGTRV